MIPALLSMRARAGARFRASAAGPGGGGGSVGDRVEFPDSKYELILGPLLTAGSPLVPWPQYETISDSQFARWKAVYGSGQPTWLNTAKTAYRDPPFDPDHLKDEYYYDAARALYMRYFQTGDADVLADARYQADQWWEALNFEYNEYGGVPPRVLNLGGLIIRAMDGKPSYWTKITEWAEGHAYWMQIGIDGVASSPADEKVGYVYQGVRDGGYMLQYYTWLSHVHPDATKRTWFYNRAYEGIYNYYLLNRFPGRSWYWQDDNPQFPPYPIWANQPFHVGLLHCGLIDFHRLYGGAPIITALSESCADMYVNFYRLTETVMRTKSPPVTEAGTSLKWRNMPYFCYPINPPPPRNGGVWESVQPAPGTFEDFTETLGDTNTVRESRQANCTSMAGFAYLYFIGQGDVWKTRLDEMFASTFGNGVGPGADFLYCLMDYNRHSLNQAWRGPAQSLVWRLGAA